MIPIAAVATIHATLFPRKIPRLTITWTRPKSRISRRLPCDTSRGTHCSIQSATTCDLGMTASMTLAIPESRSSHARAWRAMRTRRMFMLTFRASGLIAQPLRGIAKGFLKTGIGIPEEMTPPLDFNETVGSLQQGEP